MSESEAEKDKHFQIFVLDNPLRRLFINPRKYCSHVGQVQTFADLRCGPGYFTLTLAETVDPSGKVYAVATDAATIRVLERKVTKLGCHNIHAHAQSTSNLSFIQDQSVDFVLADRLLCSMSPEDHKTAVIEFKRILKSS